MSRRRLLLLLKPFDVYPPAAQTIGIAGVNSPSSKVLNYLDNRRIVHKEAIDFCQDVVREKFVNWTSIFRSDLSQPIRNVDLVITVGGDGTLLQASHFIDDSTPMLGVNSDPTQSKEVEECSDEFDATRSTGYLCAATIKNFEEILDDILEGQSGPSQLSRMSVRINSELLSTYALNDVLIAHPSPAAVSRFSFRIIKDRQSCSSLVNCRSSGLRISTAAGSTAAIHSAGGFSMPILSKDLQYIVREPILPRAADSSLMHGLVKFDESMYTTWFCKGVIYIDGSHTNYSIKHQDTIELSSHAPILQNGHYPAWVLIGNTEKVAVSGKKRNQKLYRRHSGRPGGMTVETFDQLQQRIPERIVEHAVRGMLPKGRLGRALFNHLIVYKGPDHPHQAQMPVDLPIRDKRIQLQK